MTLAVSVFKPEAARRYRSAYAAALALWPVPHEALDVATQFVALPLQAGA